MNEPGIRQRLHAAVHRGGRKATEDELGTVTAVVLLVVGELTAELADVKADLEARLTALESAA